VVRKEAASRRPYRAHYDAFVEYLFPIRTAIFPELKNMGRKKDVAKRSGRRKGKKEARRFPSKMLRDQTI
jgi:hypothetical protein